jgi:CRISPR-associated endoribonuclease Cas6
MRLRVEVVTRATELPWAQVLDPGRGLAYRWLSIVDSGLGRRLHEGGWQPHGMVPFGHGAPVFPGAARQRGRYAAGGAGVVEFGSPLPEVVEAWARALRGQELLDWGGVAMRITRVTAVEPPEFTTGRARMRTQTPVVMKLGGAGAGAGGDDVVSGRRVWVLPTEPEFPVCLQHNLDRKLETLGVPGKAVLEAVTWVGPKRSFGVGSGAKPGAPVEVELSGDPEALRAVWSWGLGQANPAGFGWVLA